MSKKYSLYVNNDNLYGCSGTYKVMDGKGTVITDTTALTLDASGKTKIGEQTVADTEVAYWGGTKFTFTSVGAPTSVSGKINRNDYHYYDLSATPITYYFGNNFSMSFSLAITAISGQTITYPKVFSIATNENFTNAESVSFASAGTQSLHYTESNFGGDKGTGYLYIKDTENNAVYMFINTLKIFNKPTLTQTSISTSGTTYSVVFTATNPNDIACNLWTTNYTEAFTDQGTISANGTLSFTITSSSTTGIAHAYLKLDNVRSAENSKSWEYIASLRAIVITSAIMTSSSNLRVIWSNPNSVECRGYVYGQNGMSQSSIVTFGASATGTTNITVANVASQAYVGAVTADGYTASVIGDSVNYSAYIKTLIILGATSVDVGSTANLYAYDETDDPEHNTPLIGVSWSSTGTYATVNSSTGVVTGISDGAETITATKPGYTQGTYNIRINGVSEMLSPSITNVSTTTNEIDQSLTETILSFRVENINGFDVDCVSSAVVGDDDVSMGSSSGTCEGDYWLDISLSVPGDYSGITGLITVTFSKPGYNNAVSTKDFTVS